MRRSPILRLLVAGCLVCVAARMTGQQPPRSLQQLREGFRSPPPEGRLRCYWWWLNGHTDKATITHDLEEMAAKGFGGALLVDANGADQEGNLPVPAGPRFGSPEWVELYTHALREADRLGLEITLNISSGWNLGGPDVPPEQSAKLLTWTRTEVHGDGGPRQLALPMPAVRNGFYREVAVLAYPLHNGLAPHPLPGLAERSAARETGFSMPSSDWMLRADGRPGGGFGLSRATANDGRLGNREADATVAASERSDTASAEVVDLSPRVHDGAGTWTVPAGDWEVLRIGYTDSDARVSTSSDTWQGRALDPMSAQAFDAYWDRTVQPLLQAAKPYHSLRYLTIDSWELGGVNWTEGFAAEFRARRGYDPMPWLPAIAGRVVGSPDQTTRFLSDLRRTVADLITANHYDRLAMHAAENGLGTQAESGGPHGAPIDALETFHHAAVPQTEFWSENPHRATDEQRFFVKEAASAAHIYGRTLVAAEGETSINRQWDESLATDLKPSFDMAVTEGLNRLVWHEFTSSPAETGLPGQEYFAGTHLNPKVTWWNAGGAFFTYLNRVQFMMQQGAAVSDLLYLLDGNVPSLVRDKADDPARVLPGYDYDVSNEDALRHQLKVEAGGWLRTVANPAQRWHVLALPATRRLSPEALGIVEQFVRAGGVVAGMPPESPVGLITPAQQAAFDATVERIWGSDCSSDEPRRFGAGELLCTAEARTALRALHLLPDSEVQGASSGVDSKAQFDFAHRRVNGTDLYFVRNGSAADVEHDVLVRTTQPQAQFWDAVSGEIYALPLTRAADGRALVRLHLPAFGSGFVVFPGERARSPLSSPPVFLEDRMIPIDAKGWTVQFQPDRGAPADPVPVAEFSSWATWPQPGVRFFSGTAIYRGTVSAPNFRSGEEVWLRFSDLHEIATVRINGRQAGTVWARPLAVRVDPYLRPGQNSLELEVTNLWPNRIIGDLQPGASEHITRTNIRGYSTNSPLLPSGIAGPLFWSVTTHAADSHEDAGAQRVRP